jgi:urease accessory protein
MIPSFAPDTSDLVIHRLVPTRRNTEARLERSRGEARVAFRRDGERTRLDELFQSGSAKIRLPRVFAGPPEVVFLNTAGGLTGGDQLKFSVTVDTSAAAVATTQAAERIYRRLAGTASLETRLTVGDGARLDWLPQETILFDRSSLSRSLTIDIARNASIMALEAVVLGRTAMGEVLSEAAVRDHWRIRRGGRLIFADSLRLDGDATGIMHGRATGGGASALATLVLIAPDAEARLDAARDALAGASGECGASAWNGMLVARAIAPTGQALRADLTRLVETLRDTPMPRVWNC